MRFDLYPDNIAPVGVDSRMSLGNQERRGSSAVEAAFVDAGLCTQDYIARVSLDGFGVVKAPRHRQREAQDNVIDIRDQSDLQGGVVRAIQKAKIAMID